MIPKQFDFAHREYAFQGTGDGLVFGTVEEMKKATEKKVHSEAIKTLEYTKGSQAAGLFFSLSLRRVLQVVKDVLSGLFRKKDVLSSELSVVKPLLQPKGEQPQCEKEEKVEKQEKEEKEEKAIIIPLSLDPQEPKEEPQKEQPLLLPPLQREMPLSMKEELFALMDTHRGTLEIQSLFVSMKKIPELKVSERLQFFCRELIKTTLSGTCAVEKAENHLARFLFLSDKRPELLDSLPEHFPKQLTFLEKQVTAYFQGICKRHHPHKATLADIFLEERIKGKAVRHGLVFENQYAIQIAETLLRPNGAMYYGLIDDAKKLLVASKTGLTAFDKHLLEVLDDLKKQEVQKALETIGKAGDVGEQIVRVMLCLPEERAIEPRDCVQCALSSLFGRWRQVGYGSCYAYSISAAQLILSPATVLEEYNDVLQDGALKRSIDDKESRFVAIPKMALYVLERALRDDCKAEQLWQIPPLRHACITLGADQNMVDAALQRLMLGKKEQKEMGKPLTLLSLFYELKPHLKGLTEEKWQQVLFRAASIGESPLSRVWNNAIASMFFPPFTTKNSSFETHTVFKDAILSTFTSCLKLANTRFTKQLKEKLQLTTTYFAAFEKLRIFVAPPDSVEKHYGECTLYIEKNGAYQKIENDDEFGTCLKEMFIDVAQKMKLRAGESKINKMLPKEMSRIFLRFFDSIFLDKGVRDPLYANKPWSFKLAPSHFDAFWSTYLRTKKVNEGVCSLQIFGNETAGKELLEWAERVRSTAGTSPRLVVPARYPPGVPSEVYAGHSIVLTPNHPTMIPKQGQTVDAMLQEKMALVSSLTVSRAKKTIEEAKEWGVEYIREHAGAAVEPSIIEECVKKFELEMAVMASQRSELRLQEYLIELLRRVKELCTKPNEAVHVPDEVSLNEFSTFLLQGLLTDIPGAEKSVVIHFGDSLWEYEPPHGNVSVPLDVCLFPNPLTGKWNTVYLGSTKKHSYAKVCQIQQMELYFW